MKTENIIDFWFTEIDSKLWWKKDLEFDQLLNQRFSEVLQRAERGELYTWRGNPHGRLAEIIVLDQFSRNIYRDTAQAFANDAVALVLAQEALGADAHKTLSTAQQAFLFMPYMHSESALMHTIAVQLFSEPGLEGNLNFEQRHKAIIDRFGRYPHRNALLGRQSTPEELEFLQQPGSSF
ncbi:MAG: DUF924 family protein [Pseudomonadales bacterium]